MLHIAGAGRFHIAHPAVRIGFGISGREKIRLGFSILGLITAAVAIVGCSWICWQLLRLNGRLLLRLDNLEKRLDELGMGEPEMGGLPLGSPAPDFDLQDLAAGRKTLADFRGEQFLLIFFNPGCRFCQDLVPRLMALGMATRKSVGHNPAASSDANGHPRLLIMTSGDLEQNRRFFAEHQIECPVLVQQKMELSLAYGAKGTPAGYLIDAEGKIASELALGVDMLLALLNQRSESSKLQPPMNQPTAEVRCALTNIKEKGRLNRFSRRSLAGSKINRSGLKAGTQAPDFQLTRLDGRGEWSLSALRGRCVLIVFSSPQCKPCNELAPMLEKFHRGQPDIEVVMISNGEPDENQAKVKENGLTFAVALQPGWSISRLYAIFATPAAYLVDQEGVIARDVAIGTEPIRNLLGSIEKTKEGSFAYLS